MKIAACMIVKNEEEMLAGCLESIQDYVDLIIVVDTGSSDKTIEIAKQFEKVRLYKRPCKPEDWHFSKYRNISIRLLPKRVDWILIVDADERIRWKVTPMQWRNDLEKCSTEFASFAHTLEDIDRNGDIAMTCVATRVFRGNAKLRYERSVHNKPCWEGDSVLYEGLVWEHYGYDLSPEKMKAKWERTTNLLLAELKQKPNDGELHFYLNQQYTLANKYELCVKHGLKCIELKDKQKHFNPTVYYSTFLGLQHLGDLQEAGKVLALGLEDRPDDVDLNYCLVEFGVVMQRNDFVERGAEFYIENYYAAQQQGGLQKKFTMTFKTECLARCVFALSIAKFNAAFHSWQNLINIIPAVREDCRGQLAGQALETFKQFDFQKQLEAFEKVVEDLHQMPLELTQSNEN